MNIGGMIAGKITDGDIIDILCPAAAVARSRAAVALQRYAGRIVIRA